MSATILAIDDSEDDLLLYARAFRGHGDRFVLATAQSAESGLASIGEIRPDLILLDFNLPDMDGLDFMRKASALPGVAVPTVMLTGEGNAEVAVEAMKSGAEDYLVKDTEGHYLRLLPTVVGRVIEVSRQREESRRLQQETAALLRRNQALMQNSMDGIHLMDMRGNIVEANEAFCSMLGYSQEEMAGRNVADWDAQWSPEELRERFHRLIHSKSRFETVHRRKDGTLIDVEISTSGIEVDGQNFLFAASRDITARKEAEAMLKQHKQVLDTSIDGFWVTDMQGRLMEVNEAYAKLSGYAVAELQTMSISQLEARERPEDVRAHIDKLMRQGYDRFETRHRHKDGHEFDIEISTTYAAESRCIYAFCRDITERKKAEAELRIAAATFETNEAIVITDADANIIKANRAFSEITGYTAEDVLGRNPSMMSSGLHDAAFYREMWRQLAETGAWSGEIFDRRKNGQVYPKWLNITAIKNERDEITQYVGISSDISARKQAEKILRESEERFRTMYDSIKDAIFVVLIADDGMPGGFVEANDVACAWLGYTRQEMLAMAQRDVSVSEIGIDMPHIAQRLVAGENITFEQTFVTRDGRRIPMEVSAYPFALHGRKAAILLARDIFESRETELRLKESEVQYQTLADSGQALIWTSGTDKRRDYFNKVWLDFTGRGLDQELGDGWKAGVHPDDLQHCLETYVGAFDLRGKFSMDYRLRRRDGEYRWIQDDACPRYDSKGDFIGYIGYCLDITDRKFAEQQLRELSVHIQAVREEEKASVAREIHDELGSTLAALKMDASWLERKLAGEKKLQPLQQCAQSMTGLLNDAVLSMRRIITDLRPTILDDYGLLEALKWQADQFHRRTGIDCRVTCSGADGRDCETLIDKVMSINLFRIFQEALTNVARHSGASAVEVEFWPDERGVVLSVCDNGRGLPPGHSVAATSYGLRGMRERAVQLGGDIDFDSPHAGGFCVTVKLPLPAAAASSAEAGDHLRSIQSSSDSSSETTMLEVSGK